MMKKRILSLMTLICVLMAYVPCVARAEIVASGNCGPLLQINPKVYDDNVKYTLDDAGTLTIFGIGEMADNSAFALPWHENQNIKKAIVRQGVTKIGTMAFYQCANLSEIEIAESVKDINYCAFSETKWYENLPEGAVYINDIFYDYKGSIPANGVVKIKDGIKYISSNAFSNPLAGEGDTGLKHIILPESVEYIGKDAFFGCWDLEKINIPEKVNYIGRGAFSGTKITEIKIPDGIEEIGDETFCSCNRLEKIYIPRSVKNINSIAFSYCKNLTDVYYGGSKEDWEKINIEEGNDPLLNAAIHYNSSTSYEPIEPVGLTVTKRGGGYRVSAQTSYDGTAYAAVYDSRGGLIGVDSASFADGSAELAPYIPDNAASIRFFVWTNTLQPVTLAESLQI